MIIVNLYMYFQGFLKSYICIASEELHTQSPWSKHAKHRSGVIPEVILCGMCFWCVAKDRQRPWPESHKLTQVASCSIMWTPEIIWSYLIDHLYIYIWHVYLGKLYPGQQEGRYDDFFWGWPSAYVSWLQQTDRYTEKHNTTFSNQLACLFFSNYMGQVKH